MIRNNAHYELFASYTVPNPEQVGYWIDLGANSKGKIVKIYNENLRQWVKILDASSDDAVSPFIGSNGNWWVDNRDTGISATGKNPYIGDNGNWYVYDALSKKFTDTGVVAKGRSAYDLAVEYGFKGTEEEWLESLKQPALDAAQVALDAAENANQEIEKLQGIYQQVTDALDLVAEATESANTAAQNANDAADRSNLIANNPPKIVNETWYMFDEETNKYVSTGIKAIGDAFTIVKTYTSVAEMQADYSNSEVGIGQFVMIDTGDVDNPEDSQLYLKGDTEWKFISDLSGAQGIQGLSAYQVAVQEGFVGSEEEWVESLSKDSKEAAQLALQAKEQVEQTEQAVKDAEAIRVIAESERIAAENTREENEASRIAKEAERVSAEQARVDAENSRVEVENARAANETARVEAENARVTAENQRASAESSRVEAEQARVTAESGRITAEENRESAEETRKQNEEARVSAESSRVTAEQQRVTQEEQRQKNIQTAIKNTEVAIENTNIAIANAEAATENANTQADRAKEFSDNPPKIQDNFWYIWDEATDTYVNTNVQAKGEKGDQGLPGESYTLPIASSTTLGGIKVGAGLQINAETGVLNATGGGTADAVDWENITSKPDFSAVATSGDYNDLINTPDIPDISNLATKDEVALKANSSDVYTKSETYTKTETEDAIKQAAATVFKYKGTVDSFDFLPTLNVSVGDVYTLADTNEEYVATTASPDPVWEYLGVKVDLSDYSTTAENNAKYQPKGDYITEIPSEYITEDELTSKDYATNTALTEGLAQKLNTDDLTWDIIDGKPTTLAGYGITDALGKNETAVAASKLSPGCKIWGRAFTGESDVSGNLTGVVSITMSGSIFTNSTFYLGESTNNYTLAYVNKYTYVCAHGDTLGLGFKGTNKITFYGGVTEAGVQGSKLGEWTTAGLCVGGSSHDAKLHVDGDGLFTGNITLNNNKCFYIKDSSGNNIELMQFASDNVFTIGDGVGANNYDTYLSGKNIHIRSRNSSRTITSITVSENNGYVGINNNSPSCWLDVKGDGLFTGKITSNNKEVATKYPITTKTQTATTGTLTLTLDPNVYYKISNYTTLNLTLGTTDAAYMDEFMFEFTTGSSTTTLSLPSTVKWMGGEAPTIAASKTYQVSIVNNLAIIAEF